MTWLRNVLIAVDQLANALLGGHADETLSARAWRQRHKRRWAVTRWVLDALFRPLERDHCRLSYESEQQRRHLPEAYSAD